MNGELQIQVTVHVDDFCTVLAVNVWVCCVIQTVVSVYC